MIASHPVPASVQSASRRSQSSPASGASSEEIGSSGTDAVRNTTLRWIFDWLDELLCSQPWKVVKRHAADVSFQRSVAAWIDCQAVSSASRHQSESGPQTSALRPNRPKIAVMRAVNSRPGISGRAFVAPR